MRFQLPDPLPEGAAAVLPRLRFVAGYDRTPFPTILRSAGGVLDVTHDLSESGYISVPWPIDGIGFPVSVSATLRERTDNYRILTELARGKLNQVRNTVEDWKLAGLDVPSEITTALHAATEDFVHAVVDPKATDTDAASQRALVAAFGIGEKLTTFFQNAATKLQQARIGKPATRCTCVIDRKPSGDDAELYAGAFEVVQYAPQWKMIEPSPTQYDWAAFDEVVDWATGQGRPLIVGPLIDLGGENFPAWLNAGECDSATLAAYFCDFVETAILRYRDRVRDWHLCTGFNHADLHNLSQDDRLRLVVRILESARGADADGRWVVGVSQPWGEYLDDANYTLSPLVFCDTLLRSGLSIAGFSIEIIAGTHPRGSDLRDGLDLLRLFELYGLLGVPIDITASHPGHGDNTESGYSTCHRANRGADAQAEWGGRLAALAGTLPHLRCFSWKDWRDGDDHRGLLGPDGQPKPLLFRLRHLRAEFA